MINFLSPIFCLVVLSSDLSSSSEREEATLFVSLLLQGVRELIIRNTDGIWTIIAWLTRLLDAFFDASMSLAKVEHVHFALLLGFDFTTLLCETIVLALLRRDDASAQQEVIVGTVVDAVVRCVKYSLRSEGYSSPSLQPVLQKLIDIISLCEGLKFPPLKLESSTYYSLGIACLMMQDENDVASALAILVLFAKNGETTCSPHMVHGILSALGYVFQAVPSCSKSANSLINVAKADHMGISKISSNKGREGFSHVFDAFEDPGQRIGVLQSIIDKDGKCNSEMSVEGQCESLLLGLSLMCISAREFIPIHGTVYSFLGQLVHKYQTLGRRCLPILVATLGQYIQLGSMECIVPHLEFLCTSITQDASCAHEVWSILSSLTNVGVPTNVQAMAIRLYPLLCMSNRRLYSRVCESLGKYVAHPSTTLRIAAASSLCDLAKEDLIRDVSEIIGWVQTFLIDEDYVVTYSAVRTLHHLIQAEELDFSMVIKVLNKRLVAVDDAEAIVKLPDIVVEALIQLMGIGEDSESSDSDGSENGNDSEIVISQQVQASTLGLRSLALILSQSLLQQDAEVYFNNETMMRMVKLVHESLGRYSLEQIGISTEMIRSECTETSEYDSIQKIIGLGFEIWEKHHAIDTCNFDEGLIALARKVTVFEEDALGPSLWNQKTCKPFTKNLHHADLASALASLPKANEGTLTCYLMEKMVERAESVLSHPRRLSLALECLQVLSLPSQFVGLLSKAMDTDVGEKEILTVPCVTTLVAQLSIVRRSAAERRHFVELSVKVAKVPFEVFFLELWHHAQLFLESLPVLIPQWSSADAEEIIPQLWSKCSDDLSPNSNKFVSIFLDSLTRILTAGSLTSPVVLSTIYRTVLSEIFPLVCSKKDDPSMTGIHDLLYICISKIPVEILLGYKVLNFGDGNDFLRIQLIAYMHTAGILKAEDPYLLRSILWIGKQEVTSDKGNPLWALSFEIALAAAAMSANARCEVINALLEIMQINGVSVSCVHLLLLLAAKWVQDSSLIFQSSECLCDLQLSLDQQVGSISQSLGISDAIMKRVLSLLGLIDAGNHEYSQLQDLFMRIFLSLKSHNASFQHALVTASQVCQAGDSY